MMAERALLYLLIAVGLAVVASAIGSAFHTMADRIECGMQRAEVCILDDAKEQP